MTIRKALITIKGYCEKHIACGDCPLSDYGKSLCIINDKMPVDWDVEEMMKKRRGDSGEVN